MAVESLNNPRSSQILHMLNRLWRGLTARMQTHSNKCKDLPNKHLPDRDRTRTCLLWTDWKWFKPNLRPSGWASTPTTPVSLAPRRCVTRRGAFQWASKSLKRRTEWGSLSKYLTLCATLKLTIRCLFHLSMIVRVELSRISIKRPSKRWRIQIRTCLSICSRHQCRHSTSK